LGYQHATCAQLQFLIFIKFYGELIPLLGFFAGYSHARMMEPCLSG
jgi:hypothetical protein